MPYADRRFPDDRLLNAIRKVESADGARVYGDWVPGRSRANRANARAWGPYQQHMDHVEDSNRIMGTSYTSADRLDEAKSRAMSRAYMAHYGYWKVPGRNPTDEQLARIHNGGPKGFRNPATVQYWHKVWRALNGYPVDGPQTPGAPGATPARPQAQARPQATAPAPARPQAPARRQASAQAPARPAAPARPQAAAPARPAANTYQARPGDTAWSMWRSRQDRSQRWAQWLDGFRRANQGVDPSRLRPGQTYRLP